MFVCPLAVFLSEGNGKVHTVVSKSNTSQMKVKSSSQLNMRGVYLHVLGDALGSVIVIISALIIKYASGKWTIYVDPGMSIIMVLLILKTSIPLMRESSLILLQTVPTHIKIKEVQDRLLDNVEGVLSVHEFHVWQLAGNKIIGKFFATFQWNLARDVSGNQNYNNILECDCSSASWLNTKRTVNHHAHNCTV